MGLTITIECSSAAINDLLHDTKKRRFLMLFNDTTLQRFDVMNAENHERGG